ncbi:MAG TPA: ribosome maturation factor RimM [Alphaproteobacteria bacterium]|nr:MAG: 16S rRNA processing protein RimM [Rhodospirillales bacterium]HOO82797.1 ribosome maturation factor RimM [Alphaproteobacteria bacterium]
MTNTVKTARTLRKNQTDAEKLLWSKLRNRQFENLKFRRQHPVPPYVADFYCEDLKLIVEIDGGQHTPEKDRERQKYIEDQGYKIIRFWNNDVLSNIDGVLEKLSLSIPSPKPSPQGEGLTSRICVGRIASAHGVKGLVKLLPFCEDPALLEQALDFKITLKNPMGKYMLAEIEGVKDRNAAEALRNTELFVTRDQLPEIDDDDTFYFEDLIGMTCVDENGMEIGHVKAVENFGAGDLLEVQLKSGQEVLLPFTDEYVPEIGETVTIRNYERLML